MKTAKLRGKIVERGCNGRSIAAAIGVAPSTFYRKLHNESFTCKEAMTIAETLTLTSEEAREIFLT